jgi:hypothetical protein
MFLVPSNPKIDTGLKPTYVHNLVRQIWCDKSGATIWRDKSGATTWCDKSGATIWCDNLVRQIWRDNLARQSGATNTIFSHSYLSV